MAKINKKMLSFFFKWEGGLSNDPNDSASSFPCPMTFKGEKGWHTNKGITYKTWVGFHGNNQKTAFLNMTDEDVIEIFKKGYWDKVKADKINSDAIAVCLTSWAWGSGSVTAIKQIQRLLQVPVDGKIGKITLGAINDEDEKELFNKMCKAREYFFRYISEPRNAVSQTQRTRFKNNRKFINGWINRLRSFEKTFAPK